jgi:hypothetical protein
MCTGGTLYPRKPSRYMWSNHSADRLPIHVWGLLGLKTCVPLMQIACFNLYCLFTTRMGCHYDQFLTRVGLQISFFIHFQIHTGMHILAFISIVLFIGMSRKGGASSMFHMETTLCERAISFTYGRKSASSRHCDLVRQSWFYWLPQYALSMKDSVYAIFHTANQ